MKIRAEDSFDHPPRPLAQKVGAVLWPSFFSACIDISREAGYSIAFFMFWIATASACLFTWILLRPSSRFNRPPAD